MAKKEASHIKDVARGVLKRLAKDGPAGRDRIKKAWEKAAGKGFRGHTLPVSFRKRRLVVNVDSSGWLYEITMKKREISAKLKRALKDDFAELRFRIGEIAEKEK